MNNRRLMMGGNGDPYNGHEYVDLGLSVKWASCNVGAQKASDYGYYFAWGETDVSGRASSTATSNWSKSYYWVNAPYFASDRSSSITKYCDNSNYGQNGFTDNKTVLEPMDDAATVNWGSPWRMPTQQEWDELSNSSNCKWEWTTEDGILGYRVISAKPGYTNNSIFLPAAGYRYGSSSSNVGSFGDYWSSSLYTSNTGGAYGFGFYSGNHYASYRSRYYGQSVRGVFA